MSEWRTNRRTRKPFRTVEATETSAGVFISPPAVPIGTIRLVRDFDDDYVLVQTDSEVYDILSQYDPTDIDEYQYLLVLPGDAEYSEIWGIEGEPYMDASATLIHTERK